MNEFDNNQYDPNQATAPSDTEKMQYYYVEDHNKKNNGGFGKGMLFGALLLALAFFIFSKVYTNVFGGYLIIGNENASAVEKSTLLSEEASKELNELLTYIDLYSVNPIEEDTLNNAFYHALVESLGDKYSAYFDPEEYEQMMTSTTGTYYGIGAGLQTEEATGLAVITKIYEGTPSEEAGLKKDDKILKVNDIDSTSVDLTTLVSNIRGEEGTSVHLVIYRPSTDENLEFDVVRRNVVLPSVSSQMLDENIGYVQVSEFQSKTPEQFTEAIEKLQKDGMTKLVIDLRSNPGGLVPSVVSMLDYILPEGVVVYTEDKYGNRTDFNSEGSSVLDIPMVVLVDENSASASEIFAGAMKDYGAATILGTTTYGKGIVQSIWPLSNGGAIKLTTAKYYTPNGVNIHEIGIEPDVYLEYEFLGGEDDTYAVEFDNQIQKAMELLKAE